MPDLATIAVKIEENPVAWLDDQGPSRNRKVIGIGFGRFDMPAASESGDLPLSELTLSLSGREGESWRVAYDVVTEGLSGGPVIDLASKKVVGVMKARSGEQRKAVAGGWIIGTDVVAREFAGLFEQNQKYHSQVTEWRELVTQRRARTLSFFGKYPEPPSIDSNQPPSMWLHASNGVVPFIRTGQYEELIQWILDSETRTAPVRLMQAPGGAGKTRLGLELAKVAFEAGWVSGLIAEPARIDRIAEGLAEALESGNYLFIVIDYAETCVPEVRRLLSAVPSVHAHAARILLLARNEGQWWRDLAPSSATGQLLFPEPTRLTDLGIGAPLTVAVTAYRAFRAQISNRNEDDQPPDRLIRAAESHTQALDLLAAALACVLDPSATTRIPNNPLEEILQHERLYWRRSLDSQAGLTLFPSDRLGDRLLSLSTLYPALGPEDAAHAVRDLVGDNEHIRSIAGSIALTIAGLYPKEGDYWWSPMRPDRLGETLIAGILRSNGFPVAEWLTVLLRCELKQAIQSVTVLARVAGLDEAAPSLIVDARQSPVSPALAVIAALVRVGPDVFLPAAVIAAAALAAPAAIIEIVMSEVEEASYDTLTVAANHAPVSHLALTDLAVTIEQRRVDLLRERMRTNRPLEETAPLGAALARLADRLEKAGRGGEARAAARQAVAVNRMLTEIDPTWAPQLADSLRTQGNCLAMLQVFEEELSNPFSAESEFGMAVIPVGESESPLVEAARATLESVSIYQMLAEANPSRWLPELAQASMEASSRLCVIGQMETAQQYGAQAVEILERLVGRQLGDLQPVLAAAYHILGYASERDPVALDFMNKAVEIRETLAEKDPANWLPDLAKSLDNLGRRLKVLNDVDGAIKVLMRAAKVRREIIEVAFTSIPFLRSAFATKAVGGRTALSKLIAEAGGPEEAAEIRRRALDAVQTYWPSLALTDFELAHLAHEAGDLQAAMEPCEEAAKIFRMLAETNPERWSLYDEILHDLWAILLTESGRGDEAVAMRAAALERKNRHRGR